MARGLLQKAVLRRRSTPANKPTRLQSTVPIRQLCFLEAPNDLFPHPTETKRPAKLTNQPVSKATAHSTLESLEGTQRPSMTPGSEKNSPFYSVAQRSQKYKANFLGPLLKIDQTWKTKRLKGRFALGNSPSTLETKKKATHRSQAQQRPRQRSRLRALLPAPSRKMTQTFHSDRRLGPKLG